MMKRLFILFTIFLSYASTTLQAQDNLPQNFSISLGGGVTLPRVEGNRNDFFSKNGDRAGYNLMTEGRYYFMPNFAQPSASPSYPQTAAVNEPSAKRPPTNAV